LRPRAGSELIDGRGRLQAPGHQLSGYGSSASPPERRSPLRSEMEGPGPAVQVRRPGRRSVPWFPPRKGSVSGVGQDALRGQAVNGPPCTHKHGAGTPGPQHGAARQRDRGRVQAISGVSSPKVGAWGGAMADLPGCDRVRRGGRDSVVTARLGLARWETMGKKKWWNNCTSWPFTYTSTSLPVWSVRSGAVPRLCRWKRASFMPPRSPREGQGTDDAPARLGFPVRCIVHVDGEYGHCEPPLLL